MSKICNLVLTTVHKIVNVSIRQTTFCYVILFYLQPNHVICRVLQKQHPEMFYKKGILEKFSMFTGKHFWISVTLSEKRYTKHKYVCRVMDHSLQICLFFFVDSSTNNWNRSFLQLLWDINIHKITQYRKCQIWTQSMWTQSKVS